MTKSSPEVFAQPPRRVTATVPAGVFEALNTLARRSGLRPSDVAREALREYRPLTEEISRIDREVTL